MLRSNPFKLEKLKIYIYGERERSGSPTSTRVFEVMFNPESFSMKHETVFQQAQAINSGSREARFSRSEPDIVSLDLIFDGTGVGDYGVEFIIGTSTKSVSEQIEAFLNLCYHKNGDIHEPNYLKIQWGDGPLKDFDCRLKSVDITYTSFDRNGSPLRAELSTKFVQDLESTEQALGERASSPDVSHVRSVRSGDTLLLMCKEIYGSSKYYLHVARANKLDHFRKLEPGREILFPPLEAKKE